MTRGGLRRRRGLNRAVERRVQAVLERAAMHNRITAQSEPVAPFGRSAVPPELRDDPIVVEHFPVVSFDGRTVGSYTVARCGDCGATRRFPAAGMASGWSARHRGIDDTATLDDVCPNRLEAAVAALSR